MSTRLTDISQNRRSNEPDLNEGSQKVQRESSEVLEYTVKQTSSDLDLLTIDCRSSRIMHKKADLNIEIRKSCERVNTETVKDRARACKY